MCSSSNNRKIIWASVSFEESHPGKSRGPVVYKRRNATLSFPHYPTPPPQHLFSQFQPFTTTLYSIWVSLYVGTSQDLVSRFPAEFPRGVMAGVHPRIEFHESVSILTLTPTTGPDHTCSCGASCQCPAGACQCPVCNVIISSMRVLVG